MANARPPDAVAAGEVVIGRRRLRTWPGLVVLVLAVAALAGPWLVADQVSDDSDLLLGLINLAGLPLILIAVVLLARRVVIGPIVAREAPAARLGPLGVDYRVMSDTGYDMHIGWDEVIGCQMRVSKLGNPMLCFELRDPEQIIAARSGPFREALEVSQRDYGTPLVVNCKRFKPPLRAIDHAVRTGTSNRARLRP
ncbi:hypothetical protein ACFPIJ_50785 [Dactylosporangium cerinum]|uniref:Uncharacterized protein n=1 Tax=Dactylosporangium cerinum TaxID=1434730 RepID=A0ABV9WCL1_9ACTN